MDFEKRLERAITRGSRTRDERDREASARALTDEEFRTLHSTLRIELSDHVEDCLRKLADHFPGFRFETVVGGDGWGARISRDDADFSGGGTRNLYSRLEMLVTAYGSKHLVELVAKGTIRNKDALERRHYQMLQDADADSFREMIDLWVLEYAEKFAAGR